MKRFDRKGAERASELARWCLAMTLAGCVGVVDEPAGNERGPGSATLDTLLRVDAPGRAPAVRMLTTNELRATYQTLFGFVPASLDTRPADPVDYYYPAVSQSQTIAQSHVIANERVADEAAVRAVDEMTPITRYAPTCSSLDRACARAYVDAFVPIAWRRPLDDAERTRLLGLFDLAPTTRDGLMQVIRATLLSPSFLYLVQEEDTLDAFEVAARLSFALCHQPPDDALLAAAATGDVLDGEVRLAHATRLLEGDCGARALRGFFGEWLGSERVHGLDVSDDEVPDYEDVADAMIEETAAFVERAALHEAAPLSALFTADYTVADRTLAPLYGLDDLPASPENVTLPPGRRGLLTHPSVLASYGNDHGTSVIHRGVFVLRRLLCVEVPPPPPDVAMMPPLDLAGASTRDIARDRMSRPECGSCHGMIDPIGLAFEPFDELGRTRTTDESGHDVNGVSGLPLAGISLGRLDDATQLADAVAETPQLHACFSRQWLRYVFGRLEEPEDEAALREVAERSSSGAPLTESMLALFASPDFVRR